MAIPDSGRSRSTNIGMTCSGVVPCLTVPVRYWALRYIHSYLSGTGEVSALLLRYITAIGFDFCKCATTVVVHHSRVFLNVSFWPICKHSSLSNGGSAAVHQRPRSPKDWLSWDLGIHRKYHNMVLNIHWCNWYLYANVCELWRSKEETIPQKGGNEPIKLGIWINEKLIQWK